MSEPIRACLEEVNFAPEDGNGVLVTLRVGDTGQTYRAGRYLLFEADREFRPIESD